MVVGLGSRYTGLARVDLVLRFAWACKLSLEYKVCRYRRCKESRLEEVWVLQYIGRARADRAWRIE